MKRKSSILTTILLMVTLLLSTNGYSKMKIGKSGLKITGKEYSRFSTKYFGVVDFKFENTTQEWIRIKNLKAYFKDVGKNQNIKFTSGKDLAIWTNATEKMKAIEDEHARIVLGVIAGLGIGLAGFADSDNLQTLGTLTTLGSVASLSIIEFNKHYDKVEKAKIFPPNHLFAEEFIVPPGLFVKRFLVLNTKNHEKIGYIRSIFLEYQIENNNSEVMEVKFRTKPAGRKGFITKWQKDLISSIDDEGVK